GEPRVALPVRVSKTGRHELAQTHAGLPHAGRPLPPVCAGHDHPLPAEVALTWCTPPSSMELISKGAFMTPSDSQGEITQQAAQKGVRQGRRERGPWSVTGTRCSL